MSEEPHIKIRLVGGLNPRTVSGVRALSWAGGPPT